LLLANTHPGILAEQGGANKNKERKREREMTREQREKERDEGSWRERGSEKI